MFRGFRLGSRRVTLGGALASAMAVVAVVIVMPGGAAAASEAEYTGQFTAPCVLGPGVLNIELPLSFSART